MRGASVTGGEDAFEPVHEAREQPGLRYRLLGGRRGSGKRCNRCWKAVDQLQPVIDGRCEFWVCRLCAAEMEITNASTIDIPRG